MVDHDDAGIRSAANVDFGVGPDGSTALILKGCQHEQMVGKAVYMLAPGGWAQVCLCYCTVTLHHCCRLLPNTFTPCRHPMPLLFSVALIRCCVLLLSPVPCTGALLH